MTETPSFECGKFYPGQGPGNRRDDDPGRVNPKHHPRRKRRDADRWGPKGPIRERPPGPELVVRRCWICEEYPAANSDGYACDQTGSPNQNGPCNCKVRTVRYCTYRDTVVPNTPQNLLCPPNQYQTEAQCASVCRDGIDIDCPTSPCVYYSCCLRRENEQVVPCTQFGPTCRCQLLASAYCRVQVLPPVGVGQSCPPPISSCDGIDQSLGVSLNSTDACDNPNCADQLGPPYCPEDPIIPRRIDPSSGPLVRNPDTDRICPDKTVYFCVPDDSPSTETLCGSVQGSNSIIVPPLQPNQANCRCRKVVSKKCQSLTVTGNPVEVNGRIECIYTYTQPAGSFGEYTSAAQCSNNCKSVWNPICPDGEPIGPVTRTGPPTRGPETGPRLPGEIDGGITTGQVSRPVYHYCKGTATTQEYVSCTRQGIQSAAGPCRCLIIRKKQCETALGTYNSQGQPQLPVPPPAGAVGPLTLTPCDPAVCKNELGPPENCRVEPDGPIIEDGGFQEAPEVFWKCVYEGSPNNPIPAGCISVRIKPSTAIPGVHYKQNEFSKCEKECLRNRPKVQAERVGATRLGTGIVITPSTDEGLLTGSPTTPVSTFYRCSNGQCFATFATTQQAVEQGLFSTLATCMNSCQTPKTNNGIIIEGRTGITRTEPTILGGGNNTNNGQIIFDDLFEIQGPRQLSNRKNLYNPNRQEPFSEPSPLQTKPNYELPENSSGKLINLDPDAAVYTAEPLEFTKSITYNTRLTNIFSNYVHEAVLYFLDKNNTTEDWRSYYLSDLTIENIEKSLRPSIVETFTKIKDPLGNLIGKTYFLNIILSKLIDGTIESFDYNYYKELSEIKVDPIEKPRKTPDRVLNALQAFAYLENHLIPLDPNKSTGRTNKISPLIKTFATDLEKAIPIIIDGVETKYYINDNDIVVGRGNLKISDGDYITVGIGTTQKRIYLSTEKDHAYMIRDIDREIALDLLDGDPSITLTVSTLYSSSVEYSYPTTFERDNVYFCKLITDTVQTESISEFLDSTVAKYEVCSVKTQEQIDEINEYIKFKINHYMFPVNPEDIFLDHALSAGHIFLRQQDIRFDGHARKTNKNVPILVRQVPWYVLIYPTDKTQHNPFDVKSTLDIIEKDGIVQRSLSYEMSIDTTEYDKTLSIAKFINVGTAYPEENIFAEVDLDSRKVTFNPNSEFFSSGYRSGQKTTTRDKTPLRKLKEIITELNNNYVLDRGLTTFDLFSRLKFTDFNKLINEDNSKLLFDKIKRGLINDIQVYEVTKYSGSAYINKTALVKRRATATEDNYNQIRGLNTGEFIQPPTQTDPPKLITPSIRQIKPLK